MRVRTFLILALVLGVIYFVTATLLANESLLGQPFNLLGGVSLPVGWVVFWSFIAGVALTASVGLAREAGLMVERWRLRSAGRKAEKIEEEYSRGLVAVVEGRVEQALRSFRAVLERDSRHFNTLIKLGEVLRGQEKFAEAIECHRKAQHLKPESTQPLYQLVDDYEARGDVDRARAVLGKIIAIDKTSASAWRRLRSLYQRESDWDSALEAQERIEKLRRPDQPHRESDERTGLGIRYEIAAARLEAGRTRESIAGFRRVLKESEAFIPAHVGLGEALRESGSEADALQAWYRGFEITGSPIFLTVLEEHHLRREQPLGAIEALKHCIAGARTPTLPRFYLGKLYFRLEMLDDAQEVLSSLEGLASYAPTLHYLLGRIHERRNNHREAVAQYRRVIKEMELVQLDYKCRACEAAFMEWTPRCSRCDEWNTIEINFREEISLEELGLAPAPIYTAGDLTA
jgi:lipopolysaccharide biosynthesis regulator YciM